jgi:hypothetical protein
VTRELSAPPTGASPTPASADVGEVARSSRRRRRWKRRIKRRLRKLLGRDWRIYAALIVGVVAVLGFVAVRLSGDDAPVGGPEVAVDGPVISVPVAPAGPTTTTWVPPELADVDRAPLVEALQGQGLVCRDLMTDTPNPDDIARWQCEANGSIVAITGRGDEAVAVVLVVATEADAPTLVPLVAEGASSPTARPQAVAWATAALPTLTVDAPSAETTIEGVPYGLSLDGASTVLAIGQPSAPS